MNSEEARQIYERAALGALHLRSASLEVKNWYGAEGIAQGVRCDDDKKVRKSEGQKVGK